MSTSSAREQLIHQFQDKEFRGLFVAEHIYSRLPVKIRVNRERRGWTQKQLGERAGMAQTWVSKLEDPNYGKLTIATLLKVASGFDVGLSIDFVPFSQILNEAISLSPEAFEVPSFKDDPLFSKRNDDNTKVMTQNTAGSSMITSDLPLNLSVPILIIHNIRGTFTASGPKDKMLIGSNTATLWTLKGGLARTNPCGKDEPSAA